MRPCNGGRTTETRHASGKQEVTPPKRGSSIPNYLDQTQTRGLDRRRREKVIWKMFTRGERLLHVYGLGR